MPDLLENRLFEAIAHRAHAYLLVVHVRNGELGCLSEADDTRRILRAPPPLALLRPSATKSPLQ